LSYTSTGSSEPSIPSAAKSPSSLLEGLDRRHGLAHPPEDDAARLVPLELDRHNPATRLEPDRPELERRPEHEGRPENRVSGEGQLGHRGEDPDSHVPALPRRQHVHRLGETDLERETLHRELVQVARVGEHGELVPGERCVGKDVGDDVAK